MLELICLQTISHNENRIYYIDVQCDNYWHMVAMSENFKLFLQARSDLIPGIVILIQKMARGFMARRYFRRLKAAYVIAQYYRRYKRRSYIVDLRDTFKDAKNMKDYGKRLTWPKENFAVRSVVPLLKMMYARWYGYMILKRIPRKDWPQLRLKVC